MQEINNKRLKVILIIVLLIGIILVDILYNRESKSNVNPKYVSNEDAISDSNKKNIKPKATSTNLVKATNEPTSNISKDENLASMFIENYIKTEIYAVNVDASMLSTFIDGNSEYGKRKIKEVNDYKTQGVKKAFKSLVYEKSENNGNVKVYVTLNIGLKNKTDNDFTYKEYKKFYEMQLKSGNDYIVINEGDW